MELTFVTDLVGMFKVEIDPNMELENVMALPEAEVRSQTDIFAFLHPSLYPPPLYTWRSCIPPLKSGMPVSEQSLSYEGHDTNNPKATMAQCGVGEKSMLLLRRSVRSCVRMLSVFMVIPIPVPVPIPAPAPRRSWTQHKTTRPGSQSSSGRPASDT